jgi:hypothetical protein
MPTARPFAYNTGASIPGTTQTGNLAVGTPLSGFTNNPQFWNGPDEELGYVIAIPVSGNTQSTPIPGVFASVAFYRSAILTEGSFVTLTNSVFGQSFTTGAECTTYLNANGYWTSFVPSPITPTPTNTSTPTPTPSITPTPTPTPSAAGVITVSWFADLNCATATYSFRKNGSTMANGGGIVSDNGSFTCVVGDVLVAEQVSGIKGIGCDSAASEIQRNGSTTVASDSQSGFNVTATSTWTVTSGTTSVNMYAGNIA